MLKQFTSKTNLYHPTKTDPDGKPLSIKKDMRYKVTINTKDIQIYHETFNQKGKVLKGSVEIFHRTQGTFYLLYPYKKLHELMSKESKDEMKQKEKPKRIKGFLRNIIK